MPEHLRRSGWEVQLVETVARHQAAPFAYGASDCMLLVADVAQAMTGFDPMGEIRGQYASAEEARAVLKAHDWNDLGEALAATYPEVPPAQARRGDAGLVEVTDGKKTVLAGVVILGDMVMGKSATAEKKGGRPNGVTFWPRAKLVKAFRIGW